MKYYDSEALIFSTEKKDGGFKVDGGIEKVESVDQVANLAILTADEYERISGEKIALEKIRWQYTLTAMSWPRIFPSTI